MRVLKIAAVVVLCTLAALPIFGYRQVIAYHFAWKMARENPVLALKPQPLSDLSIADSEGITITRFGYEFEVPWNDVEKVDDYESLTRVLFKSGHLVVFYDPEKAAKRVQTLKQAANGKEGHLPLIFGSALESDYSLVSACLHTAPEDVSLFTSGEEAVGKAILLALKLPETVNAETGLFYVHAEGLRGFQKGDPSRSPKKRVQVQLFDEQDRELEFLIGLQTGRTAEVQQADINRIIQTLRTTAAAK